MSSSKSKILYGCVICRDCKHKTIPHPNGILSSEDMLILNYSGCTIDGNNYLIEADRKCSNYVQEARDERTILRYCKGKPLADGNGVKGRRLS